MNELKALILKAYFAASPLLSPGTRRGWAWCHTLYKADGEKFEQSQMARLRKLIFNFRGRGILCEADYEDFAELRTFSDLPALPVITRSKMPGIFAMLQEKYAGNPDVYERSTGGSTGEPVHYFRSRVGDSECRGATREMNLLLGWRPGMTRYCLWGSDRDIGLHASTAKGIRGFLEASRIFGGFSPEHGEYIRFMDAVAREPGCAVYGFSGLLEECCRIAIGEGKTIPAGRVKAAWGGGEGMSEKLRELFPMVFGAQIRDLYGSRECSAISAQCEFGTYHLNPRYIVESAELPELGEPGVGMLLVTDLMNIATPIIRYEIGDIGKVESADCKCGRRGMALALLIGRRADLIELPSGKKASPLFFNHFLKEFREVSRFIIARTGDREFVMRYTGSPLAHDAAERILKWSSRLLEDSAFRLELVESLPVRPTGKLAQYIDERMKVTDGVSAVN